MNTEEIKKENLEIIKNYEDGCNNLAQRVNELLFEGRRLWYWIGNEVGGVCDFEDGDFLSTTDMVLILDNDITFEQYDEWKWANVDNSDKGYINLRSWLMGARHSMVKPKLQYGVWISVDDELPPYDESVLCCNKAEPDDLFFCHRSDNPNVQTDSNGWCLYANWTITHWMRIKQLDE